MKRLEEKQKEQYCYEIIPLEGPVTGAMRQSARILASENLGLLEPPETIHRRGFLMVRKDRLDAREGVPGIKANRDSAKHLQEVRKSELFRNYKDGRLDPIPFALAHLFKAQDYTPCKYLRMGLRQIEADARANGDEQVMVFIRVVNEKYRWYLNRN